MFLHNPPKWGINVVAEEVASCPYNAILKLYKKLVKGQVRMEKLQNSMAKDIKSIRDYQHKGLDIDVQGCAG